MLQEANATNLVFEVQVKNQKGSSIHSSTTSQGILNTGEGKKYFEQAEIDDYEQQKLQNQQFLAAMANKHLKIQMKEKKKLLRRSTTKPDNLVTMKKRTNSTGVSQVFRLSNQHQNINLGVIGDQIHYNQQANNNLPLQKMKQHQLQNNSMRHSSLMHDSRSQTHTRPVDMSTFRGMNSSLMDPTAEREPPATTNVNSEQGLRKQPRQQSRILTHESSQDQSYALEQTFQAQNRGLQEYIGLNNEAGPFFGTSQDQKMAQKTIEVDIRAAPLAHLIAQGQSRAVDKDLVQSEMHSFSLMQSTNVLKLQETSVELGIQGTSQGMNLNGTGQNSEIIVNKDIPGDTVANRVTLLVEKQRSSYDQLPNQIGSARFNIEPQDSSQISVNKLTPVIDKSDQTKNMP